MPQEGEKSAVEKFHSKPHLKAGEGTRHGEPSIHHVPECRQTESKDKGPNEDPWIHVILKKTEDRVKFPFATLMNEQALGRISEVGAVTSKTINALKHGGAPEMKRENLDAIRKGATKQQGPARQTPQPVKPEARDMRRYVLNERWSSHEDGRREKKLPLFKQDRVNRGGGERQYACTNGGGESG